MHPHLVSTFRRLGLLACFGGLLVASEAAETAAPSIGDLQAFQDTADTGALVPALRARIREADTKTRRTLEKELLAIVSNSEATTYGRVAALDVLAGFASDASIAPLGALVDDARVGHAARLVLQAVPGRKADDAFLAALGRATGVERHGIVDSLAMRRVARAVAPLAALARGEDALLAVAATRALGAIGDEAALKALASLDPAKQSAKIARAEAIVLACEKLITARKAGSLVRAQLAALDATESTAGVQHAVWRLSLRAEPAKTAERIAQMFASADSRERRAAAQSLDLVSDERARAKLVAAASDWSAESRVLLLENLSSRGSESVLPLARASLSADTAELRSAALVAVGRLGDASDFSTLLSLGAEGAARSEILAAIGMLPDRKVDALIAAEYGNPASPYAAELPDIMALRGDVRSIPVLLAAGPTASRPVAASIYRALGDLGGFETAQALIEQRAAADANRRGAIERAVVAIGRRLDDGTVTRALAAKIGAEEDEWTLPAVRMIGAIGDLEALSVLGPRMAAAPVDAVAARAVFGSTRPEAVPLLLVFAERKDVPEDLARASRRALVRLSEELIYRDRALSVKGFESSMRNAADADERAFVVKAVAALNPGEYGTLLESWKTYSDVGVPEAIEARQARMEGRGP
jgi:hypothetical protein